MKLISIFYNDKTKYILDEFDKDSSNYVLILFDMDFTKDKKTGRKEMSKYSAKELPFIIIEDENCKLVKAIWAESKPNWHKEIQDGINR
jgi:hypothetical protein